MDFHIIGTCGYVNQHVLCSTLIGTLLRSYSVNTSWSLDNGVRVNGDEASDFSALYFAILEYMEQLNSEKAKFILRMDW